jgi:hypothetical protein
MDEDRAPDDDCSGARRTLFRAGIVAIALTSLTLLTARCSSGSSGPGVASVGSATATTAQPSSGSGRNSSLAYAKCMRSHGLPNFPDPDGSGDFAMPGDISPTSPRYIAANKACQSLNSGSHLSPAKQAQMQSRLLAFAECMRTHGVPNYPDPTFGPDGSVTQAIGKSSGVDPDSPQYEAAQKACQQNKGGGS